MTIQTLLPLLIGFFLGGILTEIRWIRRLRRLQGGQGYPHRPAEAHESRSIEESVQQGLSAKIHALPGLRLLRDQLLAETKSTTTAQLAPTDRLGDGLR